MNIIDTFRKQQRPSPYKIIFDYVDSLPEEEEREFFWKLITKTGLWDASWLEKFIMRMPSLDFLRFKWDLQPLISLRRLRMRFEAILYQKKLKNGQDIELFIIQNKRDFLKIFWEELTGWFLQIRRDIRKSYQSDIIHNIMTQIILRLVQESNWEISEIENLQEILAVALKDELEKFHILCEKEHLRIIKEEEER